MEDSLSYVRKMKLGADIWLSLEYTERMVIQLFENFPKDRKPLPPEYAKIYENQYKSNRSGGTTATSVAQRMEAWLHKKVAMDSASHLSTLEIGAGNLNQLQYESTEGGYDIVEPFTALYENEVNKSLLRNIYNLIEDVPLSNRYDRITSCAAFEHIPNLPYVVSKTGLLLNNGGCLRTAVPSEGGMMWKLGYSLTTGLEFKMKYKLNYSVLMKHEHVNTVDEIQDVIRYFYKDVSTSRYGVGKHFSLYSFFEARNPDIDRCKQYLCEN